MTVPRHYDTLTARTGTALSAACFAAAIAAGTAIAVVFVSRIRGRLRRGNRLRFGQLLLGRGRRRLVNWFVRRVDWIVHRLAVFDVVRYRLGAVAKCLQQRSRLLGSGGRRTARCQAAKHRCQRDVPS
ncbi:MAG: hypothetical protein IID33_16725 [Planctomycetes bacterium]|nr:hypothetical protein [Planctomycetota bacterium]